MPERYNSHEARNFALRINQKNLSLVIELEKEDLRKLKELLEH